MAEPNREQWRSIDRLFEQALELPRSQRAKFLSDIDPAHRGAVEELLNAHHDSGSFLDDVTTWLAPAAASAVADLGDGRITPLPSEQVGPYTIISEIGRGGMGAVYLAERKDVELRVAIKFVPDAFAAQGLVERFYEERKVLARLEHPNIARLLDAGVTDQGTPYFAMEYVADAVPFNQYVATHNLSIKSRLELFSVVCDAVRHAHQNLIVHRDLKPSNILVTKDGTVKLLDFGIAKALDTDSKLSDRTETAGRRLTPNYAAPEQVAGDAIAPATDVYSLGIILYETLAGVRPYQLGGSTLTEILHTVCEAIPQPPSLAQAGDGSQLTNNRSARELKGDLDAITMKALRKEPERRYPTAAELVQDIRKHLAELPISARPDSVRYRTGKFVRRHSVAVFLLGLFLLSLVAGIIGTSWQARVAQDEALVSSTTLSLVLNMFDSVDPGTAQGQEVSARDLLSGGLTAVEELENQPQVKGTTLNAMARLARSIGAYDLADSLYRDALLLRELSLGNRHPDVAETLFGLGNTLADKRNFEEATRVMERSHRIRLDAFGPNDPRTVQSLNGRADLLFRQERDDEATALFRDVLAVRAYLPDESLGEVAEALTGLAAILRYAGKTDSSIALHREALDLRHQTDGALDPETIQTMYNLAEALRSAGQFAEAAKWHALVIDRRREIYNDDHPDIAEGLYTLAFLNHRNLNKPDTALILYRDAVEMYDRIDPDVLYAGYSSVGLGQLLVEQERPEEADTHLRSGVAIYTRNLDDGHPLIISARSWLGKSLFERGRFAEAEPLLSEGYQFARGDERLKQRAIEIVEDLIVIQRQLGRSQRLGFYQAELERLSADHSE